MTITLFRYPGSKNKMLSILMPMIDNIIYGHDNFCDVFVGGGSVLLEVANKYPKIQLYANDKDPWIYSFWKIVSCNDIQKLNRLLDLVTQPATIEQFYKLRETISKDDVESAYRAIFFNRTCFSGILSSGPIGGKEQKSKYKVNCRYNAKKIHDKILNCHELLKDRTIVSNKDFSEYKEFTETDYPAYLDPPYVKAGKSLYPIFMNENQHKQLGNILIKRKNWVLSYDDDSLIREIYKECNLYDADSRYCINGEKTEWAKKMELIITQKINAL